MMERVEIIHDKPQEAMKVIRDVAKWGRDNGLRVWPEEWLTDDELLTEEAKLRMHENCNSPVKGPGDELGDYYELDFTPTTEGIYEGKGVASTFTYVKR